MCIAVLNCEAGSSPLHLRTASDVCPPMGLLRADGSGEPLESSPNTFFRGTKLNREIAIPGGAGIYPLAGDVASTAGNPKVQVTGLQGVQIAQPGFQGGENLEYDINSNQWVPTLRAAIQVNNTTVSDDYIITVNVPKSILVNGA